MKICFDINCVRNIFTEYEKTTLNEIKAYIYVGVRKTRIVQGYRSACKCDYTKKAKSSRQNVTKELSQVQKNIFFLYLLRRSINEILLRKCDRVSMSN